MLAPRKSWCKGQNQKGKGNLERKQEKEIGLSNNKNSMKEGRKANTIFDILAEEDILGEEMQNARNPNGKEKWVSNENN